MQDEYQQAPYSEPEPKKQLTGGQIALIVIVAVVVIGCLCAIGVVALMVLLGPEVGNVFSTIMEGLETMTPGP